MESISAENLNKLGAEADGHIPVVNYPYLLSTSTKKDRKRKKALRMNRKNGRRK